MIEFSHRSRREALERIAREPFDLLVIGCGIVGAGVARDASLRGLRVALVDAGDLGGGTSSRTSRLVHGGLRYLEQMRVRLVAQAARERDLWVRLAPGLVNPVQFLIPAGGPSGVPTWKLRLGLAAYDAVSRRRVLRRRSWRRNICTVEPLLREADRGAIYSDASVDDARFVLEVARDAHESGAAVATYAAVTGLLEEGGRVKGATVQDRWSGGPIAAHANVVVNAAGPWLDAIRGMAGESERALRPTKGIHLVLPRERLPVQNALALRAPDGRSVFVVPWGTYVIVGTTDTDHRGSLDTVAASRDDVDYLLSAVNRALKTDLQADDVPMTYASLRPLLASAAREESDISRQHAIWEDRSGLLCVAGGKLTTHRLMARQVVGRILRHLGRKDTGDVTRTRPLRPPPNPALFAGLRLSAEATDRLARRYPRGEAVAYLDGLEGRRPIASHSAVLWGDLDVAVHYELVMTAADFLVRRAGLIYSDPDHGESIVVEVADRIASAVGWSREERDRQVAEYRSLVVRSTAFRG